jgi:beta-ketoacyl-acyl-carrier-protein synthase II
MTEQLRRVVITGLGVIAPNGIGKEEFWQACITGRSGIGPITSFDASFLSTRIAGEVTNFDPIAYGLSSEEASTLDRGASFALAAAHLALADGNLLENIDDMERERVGVYIGTAMASGDEGERIWMRLTHRGTRPPRAGDAQDMRTDALLMSYVPGSAIASHYGLHGPCASFATGCSAGADAIGQAYWAIQEGHADRMLAGGTDSAINAAGINVFSVMRALSTRNDAPEQASRPYDAERDGFVMAEGAGMLLLEERDIALARGAYIYAEIIAFVSNSNAYHMTALPEDGLPLLQLLNQVMREAGISPRQIGYINSHGSSTPANDRAETAAYKAAFGTYAHAIPISSTKSMIGHTQGAASAIETIVTALSLDQQLLPPTINQRTSDPECDLDYIPNIARPSRLDVALTHSSGFGGVNTALVLARPLDATPDAHNELSPARSSLVCHPFTPACHPERSEGSDAPTTEILRCAQDDTTGFDRGRSLLAGHPPSFPDADASGNSLRRVVVTGLGIVAPNGIGKEAFWRAASRGISAIQPIQRIPAHSLHALPVQVAGEIYDFRAEDYLDRKLVYRTDRMTHLTLVAVDEALQDAAISIQDIDPLRAGAVIANTFGGVEFVVEQVQALHTRGPRAMSAFSAIAWLQGANAGQVSLRHGLQGYCKVPVNDCVGGLDALGMAYRAIQRGAADVLIAGGCEAPLHPLMLHTLASANQLAPGNDPATYRPFDRRANGLILAEGAGICILEAYEHAMRRGARIYGEITGYDQTNDAHTLHTSPHDGARYALAVSRAMREGSLQTSNIGYVSLDGRALPAADLAEADALKRVFGSDSNTLPVSVPRTMFGHSYAAAGAIDAITALLALQYGMIPPTINSSPSPAYRLNLIRESRQAALASVLIGGRSMNGVNSALAVRKV